jgi:hypothetical protein
MGLFNYKGGGGNAAPRMGWQGEGTCNPSPKYAVVAGLVWQRKDLLAAAAPHPSGCAPCMIAGCSSSAPGLAAVAQYVWRQQCNSSSSATGYGSSSAACLAPEAQQVSSSRAATLAAPQKHRGWQCSRRVWDPETGLQACLTFVCAFSCASGSSLLPVAMLYCLLSAVYNCACNSMQQLHACARS